MMSVGLDAARLATGQFSGSLVIDTGDGDDDTVNIGVNDDPPATVESEVVDPYDLIGADEVLEVGDVAYLIGDPVAVQLATMLLGIIEGRRDAILYGHPAAEDERLAKGIARHPVGHRRPHVAEALSFRLAIPTK